MLASMHHPGTGRACTTRSSSSIMSPVTSSPAARPAAARVSPWWSRTAARQHASASSAGYFDAGMLSIRRLQQQQQQQQQLQPLQLAAPGGASPAQSLHQQQQPSASQDSDLLWAGYSALEEQLHKAHARHESLSAQVQELQAKLHAAQQQQPASAWHAASFLLFFLAFINFWGLVVHFQAGMAWPWVAAKASTGTLWMKQLLGVALPVTNTAVVLIFCVQAIRAAWTCLKW